MTTCPQTSSNYYSQNCMTANPFWNCSTKGSSWNIDTDEASSIQPTTYYNSSGNSFTGYVMADLNSGTSDMGNRTYMLGCPYGMAYCQTPSDDGLTCKSVSGFRCIFDPSFLNDDPKTSGDSTNISLLNAKSQQNLFNLNPSQGPATISVLRPRIASIPFATAACACTETGMLPPRSTRDSSSLLCSLDQPCFEDSIGPWSYDSSGVPRPNTALNCVTGGTCTGIINPLNYTTDGTMGKGGAWNIVASDGTNGTRYVRAHSVDCQQVQSSNGVSACVSSNDQVKVVMGYDPELDTVYIGAKGDANSCGVPGGSETGKFDDSSVFTNSKHTIKNFCGRQTTLRGCKYGDSSGTHYVAYSDTTSKNAAWNCNKDDTPMYGAIGIVECPDQSCSLRNLDHFHNATDQLYDGGSAQSSEIYISQHEVCSFYGISEENDRVPNPFNRVWAINSLGLTDSSDANLYPGDTRYLGKGIYTGTIGNPVDMGGGYAEDFDAWCGSSTLLTTPPNNVNNTPGSTSTYTPVSLATLPHAMVGMGLSTLSNITEPPDRPTVNSLGDMCEQKDYRYYAPLWMGNRGLNSASAPYDQTSFPDSSSAPLIQATWDQQYYYQPYPKLMRGSLISATGPIDANFTQSSAEYLTVLDDGILDMQTAMPVTRCVLDLDRMLGLGTYENGVWTSTPDLTYEDRVNALAGINRTSGGPEQMALTEQDLLHLFYSLRLDISLGGQAGEYTACQPLEDIYTNVDPAAWDSEMPTTPGEWFTNYRGTLGPLVNMCSFATPHYTDLSILRANYKTFAAIFHHVLRNVVRGIGSIELDQPVIDEMTNEVRQIQAYRMNDICSNSGSSAHLGCSPVLIRVSSTQQVKSIGDLARWYWVTLTDDMKEELLDGLCTYDPISGETIELSCNADGTTNASQFQNAYLTECASINRQGQPEYCTLKMNTSFMTVDDSCWYTPSAITDENQYFCIPSADGAWITPATVSPACTNETVCIQEIALDDVTAGGDVDLNNVNMSQCCTTNISGNSTGSCGSTTFCPTYDGDDPENLCDGSPNNDSCTYCVNCGDVLTSTDESVVQSCGTYCRNLFPSTITCATDLTSSQRTQLACKVCGTLDTTGTGSSLTECSDFTQTTCDSYGFNYGM